MADSLEIPQTSHWEARKHELFSGIEKRLSIGLSLKNKVDSFTIDDPPEQIREGLIGWFSQTLASFSPEVQGGYQKHREIEAHIDELDHDELPEESIMLKFHELSEDPDIKFLVNVNNAIRDLISKNQFIHGVKDDVRGRVKNKIDWTGVKDIIIHPFCITFVVNEEQLIKKSGYAVWGVHLHQQPFNFVRDDLTDEQRDKTIRHEEIHNLLDTVAISTSRWTDTNQIIQYVTHQLNNYNHPYIPSVFRDLARRAIMHSLNPVARLNSLHEEILAAAETAAEEGFVNQRLTRQNKLLQQIFGSWDEEGLSSEFDLSTASLSTAGRRAQEWIKFLKKEAIKPNDPFIQSELQKAQTKFSELFIINIRSAHEAFRLAKMLGKDAEIIVHGLLYLLQPNQFRHLISYLEYRYGGDLITQAEEDLEDQDFIINTFMIDRDFSQASLEDIIDLLTKKPDLLSSEEKARLGSQIDIEDARELLAGASSVEEFRTRKTTLEKFFSVLGSNIPEGDINNSFFFPIAESIIDEGVNSPYYKDYQLLTAAEKEDLVDLLDAHLNASIESDDWENFEEFLQSDWWANITQCGFAGQLLPKVRESFEYHKSEH